MKTTALFSLLCLSAVALTACGENPHVDTSSAAATASGASTLSESPATPTPTPVDPTPAPTPTPTPAPTPAPVPVSFGMVNFDFNSALVKSKYISLLDSVAEYLKQNPEAKIALLGNTSDEGSEAYNEHLSEQRGDSVRAYLIHEGVAKDRISVVPHGEDDPIVDPTHQPTAADLEHARELNRRVELVISK